MGFCTDEEYEEFLRSCPEFERMLIRSGHRPREVLVLGERRRAGAPLPGAHPRPREALEAEPDGPRVARALGRLLAGQGHDVPATPTPSCRRGGSSTPTTSGAPGSTASATCSRRSRTRTSPRSALKLPPPDPRRLRPPAPREADLRPRRLLTRALPRSPPSLRVLGVFRGAWHAEMHPKRGLGAGYRATRARWSSAGRSPSDTALTSQIVSSASPVEGGGERGVGGVAAGGDAHQRGARREPRGVEDLPLAAHRAPRPRRGSPSATGRGRTPPRAAPAPRGPGTARW